MSNQDAGRVERDVAVLLATGDTAGALALVQHRPSADLFSQLVGLDIRARLMQADLPEIQHVEQRVRADPAATERYGLWAGAVTAERLLLDGDPAAPLWAASLLSATTDEPYPPFPVLYARARLARIASLLPVISPSPANLSEHRRLRDRSAEDFVRCGFPFEAVVTRATAAAFITVMTSEDPWDAKARLREAQLVAARPGASSWSQPLHALRGLVAFWIGDLWEAHAAWGDAVEPAGASGAAGAGVHPIVSIFTAFGRAVARVVGERTTDAVAEAEAVIDDARVRSPLHTAGLHLNLAHLLADMGLPGVARHARAIADTTTDSRLGQIEARLVLLRADLASGTVPQSAEVKGLLAEMAGLHLRRNAGFLAVRFARDFDRTGQFGEGEALRAWGLAHLPAPREQTLWEVVLSRPSGTFTIPGTARPGAGRTASASGGAAPVGTATVRVLAPRLHVEVDGMDVPMRVPTAKLLLALVVRHPRPMHVEQAADLLWPGLTMDHARQRLNTVVYRLRNVAPALAGSLRRDGDLLSIVDDGSLAVDLWRYRARLDADDGSARTALRSVRGNLCEMQFPYDESLVDERHAFAAEWLRRARSVVAVGGDEAGGLVTAARALGFDPDLLDDRPVI